MSAPAVVESDFVRVLKKAALAIEHEAGRSAGLERNRLLSLAGAVRAEARVQANNNSVERKK